MIDNFHNLLYSLVKYTPRQNYCISGRMFSDNQENSFRCRPAVIIYAYAQKEDFANSTQ